MLAISRGVNPECEHLAGDMRSLRLGRLFDVVLIYDAIDYMTSEGDLRAAIGTAAAHLRAGGAAVFQPDFVRESFVPHTDEGGHDAPDGTSLRYLEWIHDPDPADTTVDLDFALMIRDPGKPVRVEHDHQKAGLFDRGTWWALMKEAGLNVVEPSIPDPYAGQRETFVGRRRPD